MSSSSNNASVTVNDKTQATHPLDQAQAEANAAKQAELPLPGETRAELRLSDREHEVNAEAAARLAQLEGVYVRAGRLVRVVRDVKARKINRPPGAPTLGELPRSIVRERLTEVAQFKQWKTGYWKVTPPPDWCVAAVHERGEWPGARLIEGIIEAPVLRSDGSVLARQGYDEDTGLLLSSSGVFDQVPEKPTQDDAKNAAEQLLEVVADFPFATPEGRSAWLAFALTPFARWAFEGPVPLMLCDGNVAGSGKSKLVDCVALLATGRPAPRSAPTEDNEEWRKRIMSVALAGDQLVMIDNLEGDLGSPALDAALTATSVKDRVLGASEDRVVPLRAMWCATGNNVMLKGDLRRRVLHMRLDSDLERPEVREDFRHADLLRWVGQERGRLVAQALTLLRAYVLAGKPKQGGAGWGSYEGWHELVRGAVMWAGQPDPERTRDDLVGSSDPSTVAFGALLRTWAKVWPEHALSAAQLIDRLTPNAGEQLPTDLGVLRSALLELVSGRDGGLPNPKSLGRQLGKFKSRPGPGGLRLGGVSDDHGIMVWRVHKPGAGR